MTRTITAAVVDEPGGAFTVQTVELDGPGPGDVLVEIRGVGLCHTDIAARDGFFGLPHPMVLGHEGSGVVVEIGEGVADLAVGDHVAISFAFCGDCSQCERGRPAYCLQFGARNYGGGLREDGTSSSISAEGQPLTAGFFGQSSFATHAVAAERNVVKIERDVPLEIVGPLGCGIQTGAGAVITSLDCQAGESLLVLGAGPVGLAAVMAARVRNCSQIIVSDPDSGRRSLAAELGATATIDPSAGSLTDQARAIVDTGVDYAFDSTGIPAVLSDAIDVLAPLGTLGFVGVPAAMDATLPVPIVGAMVAGLTIRGITEGDSDPRTFIPYLLDLYRAGEFPFDRLITTFPLEKIDDAVAAQLRGEVTKVVLVPGDTAA
ncbi:NAD(P)-dependent alcohol dehydrogenase [Gordonia sp. zg691]|uniref:NAD(P)-dependent alcohol dehydrogenase n=1 Tax=Gordonia jinghuaiqii TaxID=2758710 RepID=UPI001662622E|nr:NAD(P)-dependent alcohol dehydrogenase [Gordonia jinghuaiqii]MBD0860362.1 NAD(P)-dependent alcohol dehydrogenase [Gordonia jinghuaiqii]